MMKVIVLSAVAICSLTVCGESVWKDAILWYNGAVDQNNDGKWTGNVVSGGVPRQCDGSSAGSELPDARHGALPSCNGQKLNYATGNGDVYANSCFLIRTNDVHFTAWGNKTARWPCLYMPQAPSGGKYMYSQVFLLNDKNALITENKWTVLFRCRIDDFCTSGGNSWLWKATTDTSKGGTEKEIRIGFGRNQNNANDTQNYVKVCFGNTQQALTDLCIQTNEWLEVAVTVDGREESHSIRASLATTNNVRWHRDYVVTYDHNAATTNFYPKAIWLGGPRWYVPGEGTTGNGNDNFRGDIQMLAMWNRVLSDREVCEAFGGGAPNRFRLGEEDCTAEMYGGAAPAAGATVTLNPLANDKRAFPTTLTRGATFSIPFSVDKYATNTAHWLRFSPQAGSAAAALAVTLDGTALDAFNISERPMGTAAKSSYLYIKGENFTLGDHVLTLTRTDGDAGDLVYDVIELGGNWQAGVLDGSAADMATEGDNAYYTWYPDSLNLKEFVRNVERNYALSRNRKKTVVWNLPQGSAERFGMNVKYQLSWVYHSPCYCPLVTYVNGMAVHTNSNVIGGAGGKVEFNVKTDTGIFKDGENVIEFEFLNRESGGGEDKATFDFIAAEPLRPKRGMTIIIQ